MHFKFPSLDILCEREDRSSETLKKNTVTTSIASVQSVSYSNVTRFCARKCMMLHLVGQLGLEVLKRLRIVDAIIQQIMFKTHLDIDME